MPQFRKKPVVIEAEQFTSVTPANWPFAGRGDPIQFHESCERDGFGCSLDDKHYIETLEGNHIVSPMDWVIRGVKGEFYPCKPDIFAATYEKETP